MHIPLGWRLSKLTTQRYANLTLKSEYLLVDETGLDHSRRTTPKTVRLWYICGIESWTIFYDLDFQFFIQISVDSVQGSPRGIPHWLCYHLHWLQLSPSSSIRVGIYYLCTHVLDLLPVRLLAPRLSQLPFQLSHSSLQTSDFLFHSATGGHGFAIFQYLRGQVRIIRTGCRLYYWAPPSIFRIAQNLTACEEVRTVPTLY